MNNWQRDEQKTVTDTMKMTDYLTQTQVGNKTNKTDSRLKKVRKKRQKGQGSDKSLRWTN